MGYKIIFKTQDIKDISVPDDEGRQLYTDWAEGDMPEKIKIKNGLYLSNQIKAIEKESAEDDISMEWAKKATEIKDEYLKERDRQLALPPEERAKILSVFKILWWGACNTREIPDDILEKAISLQEKFYRENPKRTEPNPTIFKELIKGKRFSTPNHRHVFTIVERCVAQDKFWSKVAPSLPTNLNEI